MTKMNYKTKLIILIVGFLLFAALMLLYGYGILSNRNKAIAEAVSAQRRELEVLEREQKSFEEGKKDIAALQSSGRPPEELFSSDTKVVKEIQQLEQTALRYNLELGISVSGTTATAVKVPTATAELYAIPYTMTLDGSFEDTILFIQSLEHMPFITHVKSLAISVAADDVTRTTIASEFYINK